MFRFEIIHPGSVLSTHPYMVTPGGPVKFASQMDSVGVFLKIMHQTLVCLLYYS